MRVIVTALGTIALAGCAADLHNPASTLAEQKLDRKECKAQAEVQSFPDKAFVPLVKECLIAKGYVSSKG